MKRSLSDIHHWLILVRQINVWSIQTTFVLQDKNSSCQTQRMVEAFLYKLLIDNVGELCFLFYTRSKCWWGLPKVRFSLSSAWTECTLLKVFSEFFLKLNMVLSKIAEYSSLKLMSHWNEFGLLWKWICLSLKGADGCTQQPYFYKPVLLDHIH